MVLRRRDDAAKVPDAVTPTLEHFRTVLVEYLTGLDLKKGVAEKEESKE